MMTLMHVSFDLSAAAPGYVLQGRAAVSG